MALRFDPNLVPTAIGSPKAFIVHHTGGGGTVQGVIDTLNQRHLGVQYVMDRDGKVFQIGGPGESQMMTGWGKYGTGLSNANTVGMEVIARDDRDVTPAQIAAAKQFIQSTYPGLPVYGHGQVNPGHKQASEGMSIVNAINGVQAPADDQAAQGAPPPLRHVGGAGTGPGNFGLVQPPDPWGGLRLPDTIPADQGVASLRPLPFEHGYGTQDILRGMFTGSLGQDLRAGLANRVMSLFA
jgi:hypothetical protein